MVVCDCCLPACLYWGSVLIPSVQALKHGGDIARLECEFGCSLQNCLDLSTGLSPWSYPVPPVPDYVWQRLPYDMTGLMASASAYYSCPPEYITPVAGVQDAICRVPYYLSNAKLSGTRLSGIASSETIVALPVLGYQEYRRAWSKAGYPLVFYQNLSELQQLVLRNSSMHVVIINPNNPSASLLLAEDLLALQQQLLGKGYLIVDEAFMDVSENQSLSSFAHLDNLIVLRSFGKFFGLAGVRLGFTLGGGDLIEQLRADVNPWGVSYPAIWLGAQALKDNAWCQQQRQRITIQANQLLPLIRDKISPDTTSAGLFLTVIGKQALLGAIYQRAVKEGILLRYDTLDHHRAWLRIGLPGKQMAILKQFLGQL